MNSVIEYFDVVSPETAKLLPVQLGEPEQLVQQGLKASAVTMLGAIACRVKEPDFAAQVATLLRASRTAAASGAAPVSSGSDFLTLLFPNTCPEIEKKIAQTTGLGTASAPVVLSTAAVLLLGILASSPIPLARQLRARVNSKAGKRWSWQVLLLGAALIAALLAYFNRGGAALPHR
ncbi:MAG TPA: DUF937 domain-containing protein [Bryobacteraceae bacterium]|nr:DUF937 domain-containing protein [Bryobacteraceae bacterium]